jgi:hypothetical protein
MCRATRRVTQLISIVQHSEALPATLGRGSQLVGGVDSFAASSIYALVFQWVVKSLARDFNGVDVGQPPYKTPCRL